MKETFYSILGIDKNATEEEIKKAYRKKSKEHHPDLNKGNDAEFKKLNEAYHTLIDPDKRKFYDRTGRIKKEDDLKKQAKEMVTMMFMQVVSTSIPYRNAQVDYVLEVAQGIREVTRKSKDKINFLKTDIQGMKKVLERLCRNTDIEPFLEDALISEIQNKEFEVVSNEEGLEICKIATDLLMNYKCAKFSDSYPTTLRDLEVFKRLESRYRISYVT